MKNLARVFENVDVILNPSTGNTAPRILDTEAKFGAMRVYETLKACLYTKMGNLAGNPSISIPNGYDANNLPTSLMIQSKWVRMEFVFSL